MGLNLKEICKLHHLNIINVTLSIKSLNSSQSSTCNFVKYLCLLSLLHGNARNREKTSRLNGVKNNVFTRFLFLKDD
jgi:hypothetical protein